MPKTLITAQTPFKMLVAHITGASDPSKGVAGNPVKIRTSMTAQHFPEVSRGSSGGPSHPSQGAQTRIGLAASTVAGVPVAAEGVVTVQAATLRGPTSLQLGDFILTTGIEVDDSAATNTDEDITDTAPNGVIVIFKTAGAGGGEGVLAVPAAAPAIAGSVTLKWTSGTVQKTQTDNGSGGFAGDGNPAGSSINYATGALTLDATGDIPDNATTILITYESLSPAALAAALSSAVNDLPGYSASVLGAVVTVSGPTGPTGNFTEFKAGGSCPYMFSLNPSGGSLAGAEPSIGPMTTN